MEIQIMRLTQSLISQLKTFLRQCFAARHTLIAVGMLTCGDAVAALGGLEKTTKFATEVKDWMYVIIPVIALIGFLGIIALYMNGWIHKDRLTTWFIGLVLATAGAELVAAAFAKGT